MVNLVGIMRYLWLLFLQLAEVYFNVSGTPPARTSYLAAVYEHAVTVPLLPAESRAEALRHMMVNLETYKTQADIAGSKV